MNTTDKFTRQWILENGVPIVKQYGNTLTLRALHYRLVSIGMTNSQNHYKRVIAAMTQARWSGEIHFQDFKDHERDMIGQTDFRETDVDTEIENAQDQIKAWATHYSKNRWENQAYYPEVFIEKKALIGVFEKPCREMDIALCPCKGYPSLTYMYDACLRFTEAERDGKIPIILYFGDYDPSGEDIPRSVGATLGRMGVNVEVKRIALMEEQVVAWKLPPAPTKLTDSRSSNWGGLGQVELDAVEPRELQQLCTDSIMEVFDQDQHDALMDAENEESIKFKQELKDSINDLLD